MNSSPTQALVSGLRILCSQNVVANRLFDVFSARKNDSRETSVARAAKLAGSDYGSMLAVFRELDKLGAGRLINGRHGYATRIEWAYGIRSLAAVAHGDSSKPQGVPVDAAEEDDDDEGLFSESGKALTHEFQLRDSFKVQFKLPPDLSEKEAERLSQFVKTLPF